MYRSSHWLSPASPTSSVVTKGSNVQCCSGAHSEKGPKPRRGFFRKLGDLMNAGTYEQLDSLQRDVRTISRQFTTLQREVDGLSETVGFQNETWVRRLLSADRQWLPELC